MTREKPPAYEQAVRLLHEIEVAHGLFSPVDADTARAVLGTMVSTLFTSVVFVCTALLVAVQLASAALTPRIIAIVFKDPVTRFSLTLLVFSFTFTLVVASAYVLIPGWLAAPFQTQNDPVGWAEVNAPGSL